MKPRLRAIVGALVATVVALTVAAGPADAYQYFDTAPYYGGENIGVPLCCPQAWEEASSGFTLADATHAYMMTAGHYGTVGTPIFNGYGGTNFATVSAHNSPADVDLAPIPSARGYVWTSNTTIRTVYDWETTNQDAIGHKVCTDGSVTGHEICGATDDALNQPWMGGNYAVRSHCPGTTQCSIGGDSGSPIYGVIASGAHAGQVEAIGEHVGGGDYSDGTHFVVWIPIRYIMAYVWTVYPHANVLCLICSPRA